MQPLSSTEATSNAGAVAHPCRQKAHTARFQIGVLLERLGERSVRYRTPRPAVQDGIVYVTEDRKLEGLYLDLPIAEVYVGTHLASSPVS